jgi:membrane-associated PAP2 superfamily phosphatase
MPLVVFTAVFAVLEVFSLDRSIARAWFFDEHTLQWLGAGPGAWWARDLLHSGGRWLARAIAAGAMLAWALSFTAGRFRSWRRTAGYVALAMLTATVAVGLLKNLTNVDCPWDLAGFGGHHPYVSLFGDRPDELSQARCFPGAHASSGFALLCFYFAWRDQRPRLARAALVIATFIGIAFSVGQEARGAHFLSHDFVSAGLVWFIQLGLYVWLLRPIAVPAESLRSHHSSNAPSASTPTPSKAPSLTY